MFKVACAIISGAVVMLLLFLPKYLSSGSSMSNWFAENRVMCQCQRLSPMMARKKDNNMNFSYSTSAIQSTWSKLLVSRLRLEADIDSQDAISPSL